MLDIKSAFNSVQSTDILRLLEEHGFEPQFLRVIDDMFGFGWSSWTTGSTNLISKYHSSCASISRSIEQPNKAI